ncbi:hypothetical protein HOY34_18305 [Xinfangfangia sp. D13-10-4-6]|uniref:DUF7007 domain-containing protein n=1 Tax=Pseudogemmobacter hezensis TaxID=2737662 RepID=UPI0015527B84|nr:hypothetical protein [Pseudogemmobacter hezensis]NPD17148.1 hypothetical protein [Pseudogemmobacter hezensis]
MNTTVPITPASPSRPLPVIEFGRSADDLLVARVGGTAFAMVPTRQGRHFLATGWRLSRPLDTWRRGDFYGHSGDVADEAAFRALVAENAEHQRERAALGRREVGSRAYTPWGPSQSAMIYGEGVLCHSTVGHGGFQLAAEQNDRVHPLLRSSSGFYEEDAEWAAVAQAFPDLFTGYEQRLADETLRNHWPEAWEAIHGRALQSGESRERDRQIFERQHAGDWIVIAAVSSDRFSGFVETTATPGGQRGPGVERRRFLIPSAEYEPGLFGFVVDPTRHQVLTDGDD